MRWKAGSEVALIDALRVRAGRARGTIRLGIGDDCAVLRLPPEHDLLVTTDFSLEGLHFRRETHPAASAGHRCLARGLSDLAAMGGRPVAAFLSLAIPRGLRPAWQRGFLDGLLALAASSGTPLAGGDTAAAPGQQLLADIVLAGSVPAGTELRRSGARPGDLLYVTGALGGAAAELAALLAHPRRFRSARASDGHPHLFPQPRLQVGQRLRQRGLATAAIDVSDSLSTDLHHLCHESQVSARVELVRLPLHPLARSLPLPARHKAALHGGEDYELLFAAPASARTPRHIGGVPLTRIGEFYAAGRGGPRMVLVDERGRESALEPQGWEHRF